MRVAVNSSRSLRRYMIASGVNPHDNFLLFFEGRLEFWGGGGDSCVLGPEWSAARLG